MENDDVTWKPRIVFVIFEKAWASWGKPLEAKSQRLINLIRNQYVDNDREEKERTGMKVHTTTLQKRQGSNQGTKDVPINTSQPN